MELRGMGKAYHAGDHYENFPVASWLIPAKIRPAVIALYHFARTADDWADEGDAPAQERVLALKALRQELLSEQPEQTGLGARLASELKARGLSVLPANDLLTAFLQDAEHQPMANEAAVLMYCRFSANPVGRLMLALTGVNSPPSHEIETMSDNICTGLQLANFAQDLGQDLRRGRVYLPQSWWPAGWTPDQGIQAISQQDRIALCQRLANWAEQELQAGAALPHRIRRSGVPGATRFALEIAVTLEGGREILREIRKDPAAVWQDSPRILKWRLPVLLWKALLNL
jgi:hydroxysqualene synthase